jgi:hypothetical protein
MSLPESRSHLAIESLNRLREEGKIRELDLQMAALKREILSFKISDPKSYLLTISAFYGLIGNWAEMNQHGKIAVRSYLDDEVRVFVATTLLNTGFITESAAILSEADWRSVEFAERKFTLGALTFQCAKILDYTEFCAKAKLGQQGRVDMGIIRDVKIILDDENIQELTVTAMLDIAGDLLRDRKLLREKDIEIYPYINDKTITILQPLDLPAEEVAELDWEYGMRLFERMPEAPVTVVQIGFSQAIKQ